jgi:hypothetical protein
LITHAAPPEPELELEAVVLLASLDPLEALVPPAPLETDVEVELSPALPLVAEVDDELSITPSFLGRSPAAVHPKTVAPRPSKK